MTKAKKEEKPAIVIQGKTGSLWIYDCMSRYESPCGICGKTAYSNGGPSPICYGCLMPYIERAADFKPHISVSRKATGSSPA